MGYDAHQLQQMLSSIQSQLANVSNMAGQLSTGPVPTALDHFGSGVSSNTAALVKSMVEAELARLSPAPLALPAPVSPFPKATATVLPEVVPAVATEVKPPDPPPPPSEPSMQDMFLAQMKQAIGSGLTTDQQVWISNNLVGMPQFLQTDKGKAMVQSVLKEYYEHLNQK